MQIVIVNIQVKEEFLEAFKEATRENARNSIQEAGIARFDFIQQQDDHTKFTLIEVYRSENDPAKHKETAHYKKWRDTVEEMMAVPRQGTKFINVHPDEQGWG